MNDILDVMESGITLAKNKTDELNQIFKGYGCGETLFCLLSFVCHEIRNMDKEERELAIGDSHYFIDMMMEKDL